MVIADDFTATFPPVSDLLGDLFNGWVGDGERWMSAGCVLAGSGIKLVIDRVKENTIATCLQDARGGKGSA
jgi:hypothetical protein